MISWEHPIEVLLQPYLRQKIRDEASLTRFWSLQRSYSGIVRQLSGNKLVMAAPDESGPSVRKYAWDRWVAELRTAFKGGVPLNFLDQPVLRHTMVYQRRRGIQATRARLAIVQSIFSEAEARLLLREDYLGLPTITSVHHLTSANRSHHAAHLAAYTRTKGKRLWDSDSILEWGGGYGNMARIIRRLNPGVTYTIVDLPELLALQYVYLSSLEGDGAVRIIGTEDNPVIEPRRINLLTPEVALRGAAAMRSDVFLSTWALTESPVAYQRRVIELDFFNASAILMAAMKDKENELDASLNASVHRTPLPTSMGLPEGNEYWCR
ncbi:hypothetical protein BH23GEM9_BH23GEM9_22790 [soil metagenome]